MFGQDQRRVIRYEPSPELGGGGWEEPGYGEPRPPRQRFAS